MAYDSNNGMLVVSKPSSNQLFPGYGLVKVQILYTRILLTVTHRYACSHLFTILLVHMPQSHTHIYYILFHVNM